MAAQLYNFIYNCWSWIPLEVYGMFAVFVLITFGDSVLGLVDRVWRIVGR